jgi:CRISPR system Cascade subunit CasE
MFLSKLLVNVGDRSDRLRPGRRWIQHPYRVHQRLCMAFPDPVSRKADPEFLEPFDPARFFDVSGTAPIWDATVKDLPRSAHVRRGGDQGFLFRIDADHHGCPFILVQSARQPDWAYCFHNAWYLLDGPPQVRTDKRTFQAKDRLCFRLHANPTKKTKRLTRREQEQGKPPPAKARRLPCLSYGEQLAWLERKGQEGGFKLVKDEKLSVVPAGIACAQRTRDREEKPISLFGVHFDGILEVADDPGRFVQTLREGIGPAKAFGFGLLSLAPAAP